MSESPSRFHGRLKGPLPAGQVRVVASPYSGMISYGVYSIPTTHILTGTPFTEKLIRAGIDQFIAYAKTRPGVLFVIDGEFGLPTERAAMFFVTAPDNCQFPQSWKPYIDDVRINLQGDTT